VSDETYSDGTLRPVSAGLPDEAPEKRPAIGAVIVHKLTKQSVIVLEHEGPVNASPWFTVRDVGMATHRMRIEEIDTQSAQSAVQEGSRGQYL
jgi:hypothetical protein